MTKREFLNDMGKKPGPEYSLDRIDNNGNYEPGNCRWANWKVQGRNRSVAVIIKCGNTEITLAKFAEDFDLDFDELKEYFRCYGKRHKEEFYASQTQKDTTDEIPNRPRICLQDFIVEDE